MLYEIFHRKALAAFQKIFRRSYILDRQLGYMPRLKPVHKHQPYKKETREAEINQSIAFVPTLPIILISLILAIPTTSVVKTKGAMIICTSLINTVPSSLIFLEKGSALSGYFTCTIPPIPTPRISAMIIAIKVYSVLSYI